MRLHLVVTAGDQKGQGKRVQVVYPEAKSDPEEGKSDG